MPLRYRILVLCWLLCLTGFIFTSPVAKSQTTDPVLENLTVELWPEYDHPDVLIIYRAELSADTALPAQVTFRLPGHVETMSAVAFEQNGSLFSVANDAIELSSVAGGRQLTFPVTTRRFQLEYYDPEVLTRQDQDRRLKFNFTSPYDVDRVTFQVQEPIQSEAFVMTPPPGDSFTDPNGLKYNSFEMAGMISGDSVELSAGYTRTIDESSVRLLGVASEPNISPEDNEIESQNSLPGYLVLGTGVVVLVATIGAFWWSRKSNATEPRRRRPGSRAARRKKRPAPKPGKAKAAAADSPASQPSAGYCYHCGTALRPEASYCHSCGATRRRTGRS
jgi:hypothetical protein